MSETVYITSECTCPQDLECLSCSATSEDATWYGEKEPGDLCPECQDDNLTLIGDWNCYGCFQDAEYELKHSVIDKYKASCPHRVSYYGAENVGWQNRSGWGLIDNDNISVHYFAPNSDFNHEWTLTNNNTIEIGQSHHDSPMGESITIRPATALDVLRQSTGYRVDFDCSECELWTSVYVPTSFDEPMMCETEDCTGSWSVEEFAEKFEDDLLSNADV